MLDTTQRLLSEAGVAAADRSAAAPAQRHKRQLCRAGDLHEGAAGSAVGAAARGEARHAVCRRPDRRARRGVGLRDGRAPDARDAREEDEEDLPVVVDLNASMF